MLDYARLDTRYLLPLRERLHAALVEGGHWAEAQEDFERVALVRPKPAASSPDPMAFWRVKGARALPPGQAAILQAVFDYREGQAGRINQPPFKVMGGHPRTPRLAVVRHPTAYRVWLDARQFRGSATAQSPARGVASRWPPRHERGLEDWEYVALRYASVVREGQQGLTAACGPGGATLTTLPPPPAGRTGWPWTEGSPPLPSARPDGSPWPRVSIVTPSFNQAAFLEETIRSVLLQGYPNLEYLIHDGGSTDESTQIIRRYERWLTFWTSERDAGQSDALNRGFARTTGEILGWLNSDDYFSPGALGVAAAALASAGPDVGAVVGVGSKVDDRARVFYSPLPSVVTGESLLDWCGGMNFMQPACLFTRDAWSAAGPLRVDLDYCMDLALWLRIAARHRFLVIGDTLAFVHTHEDAKSVRARHRMFAEIALLLAVEAGAWDKAKAVLYTVLDTDDLQKRGVNHLARALGREVRQRLRALVLR